MTRVSLALSFLLSSLLVATPASARNLVSASDWSRVMRVHHCEESSWHVAGPIYQGGLGWLHSTWLAYRGPGTPLWANLASPQEQAWAMVRFVHKTLHYWPHQGWPTSCGSGY